VVSFCARRQVQLCGTSERARERARLRATRDMCADISTFRRGGRNAVTFWSWDICTDTCAICRNKLYEPSIEAQANPGLADDAGYSIAWGCCGHVFHLDCISRWLKTRSVCPLCNREWEFAKIEKIATYGDS